jgi:hypothetical protein
MSLQLSGKVKAIFDEVTYPSGFSKIEFVITTAEQYPQDVKFELVKDKCALAYKMSAGQAVTVHFNVRGNEHNGKYYVSLQAWKIESQAEPKAVAAPVAEDETTEDLPF